MSIHRLHLSQPKNDLKVVISNRSQTYGREDNIPDNILPTKFLTPVGREDTILDNNVVRSQKCGR